MQQPAPSPRPSRWRTVLALTALTLLFLFLSPRMLVGLIERRNIYSDVATVPRSDVIVVFGAVVRNQTISPLQEERLQSAIQLHKQGKGKVILLSNTPLASRIMKEYLLQQEVDEAVIEVDNSALTTQDTCRYEKTTHPDRSRIFVSQSFHLPRIFYLCEELDIEGVGFAAESISIDAPEYSLFTTARVRIYRYFREAFLMWVSVLNL